MIRLNLKEVEENLKNQDEWILVDERWIERKFRFKEYLKGIEFINQVANIAEKVNHHPFISIDYKLITLKMSSWKSKGLTQQDFDVAKKFDEIYTEMNKD